MLLFFMLCFPVLRFVGPTDNIYSCSFVQMLEQRLENAFDEAQDKVLETYNTLTVEVLRGVFFIRKNRWTNKQYLHAEKVYMNNKVKFSSLTRKQAFLIVSTLYLVRILYFRRVFLVFSVVFFLLKGQTVLQQFTKIKKKIAVLLNNWRHNQSSFVCNF